MTTFAIIGFGEVGSIFVRDLHAAGASGIAAYLAQSAAGGLADMTSGVARQIVPASSAAADDETDPGLGKRGKPKRDKDGDSPSKH